MRSLVLKERTGSLTICGLVNAVEERVRMVGGWELKRAPEALSGSLREV